MFLSKSQPILIVAVIAFSSIIYANEPDEKEVARPVCDVSFLTQNTPSQLEFSRLGISTSAVSVGSGWFSAPKGITTDEFISTTNDEIREMLARYIKNPANRITPDMQVLIDIEIPVDPRKFSSFLSDNGEERFKELITAFKRRLDIARELLPNANLGLYGVPVPSGSNTTLESLETQMNGIHAAAALGLFDSLDALYPTLYFRFGPDDPKFEEKTAGYTQAGIEAALSVRRSDNTPLSVIPLFSHKIYNGNSANNGDVGPYSLGRVQLDVAHDLTKVKRVAYWNSSDSEEIHNWIYQVDPSDWCNMPVPTGLSLTR